MADIRLKRLAKLISEYCLEVKKNDWIYISGDYGVAKELFHEIYREIIRAGGNPFIVPGGNELMEIYYKESSPEQLQWIPPVFEVYKDKLNGMVNIHGTSNTAALNNVDSVKQQIQAKAMGESIMPHLMKRRAEGSLRGVVTLFSVGTGC
ncbi:MAG TPA: hypothetical protein DCK95_06710 [Anaerolineaceae bacterium]|nr:hypothetical protein [Anaerolineaceae bacterium]